MSISFLGPRDNRGIITHLLGGESIRIENAITLSTSPVAAEYPVWYSTVGRREWAEGHR